MSSFTIRSADSSDADTVLELWRLAGMMPSRTDDETSICALVGTLIAGFNGWRGMLFRLAILPERRRAGIGRTLVAAGERSLRERGARRVGLQALKTEQVARDFWLAVGYSTDDYSQRYVRNL